MSHYYTIPLKSRVLYKVLKHFKFLSSLESQQKHHWKLALLSYFVVGGYWLSIYNSVDYGAADIFTLFSFLLLATYCLFFLGSALFFRKRPYHLGKNAWGHGFKVFIFFVSWVIIFNNGGDHFFVFQNYKMDEVGSFFVGIYFLAALPTLLPLMLTDFSARTGKAVPQKFEIDFVGKILSGLSSSLPDDAKGVARFNPLISEMTAENVPSKKSRSGYSYPTTTDEILNLRVKFQNGVTFMFRVTHWQMDKIKNRKSKYKGSEHRIFYDYQVRGLAKEPKMKAVPNSFNLGLREVIANKVLNEGYRVAVSLDKKIKTSSDSFFLRCSYRMKNRSQQLEQKTLLNPHACLWIIGFLFSELKFGDEPHS